MKKRIKRMLISVLFCCLVLNDVVPNVYGEEILIQNQSEVETENQTETESEVDAESQTETESVSEEKTEVQTEIYTESQTEIQTGEQTEAKTEVQTEIQTEMGTEVQTEALTEVETECQTEKQTEKQTEMQTEMETETETGTETETETECVESESQQSSVYLADLEASGRSVIGIDGWTQAANIDRLSSAFYPVRFYNGISSVEGFCSSSKVKQSNAENGLHFYPTSEEAEGKFGVIYRKVLYYNYQWYDLKLTVQAFSTEVRSDGGDTVKSFPFIDFQYNRIGFYFHEAVGEMVLKCEFLNSQTGAVTKVDTRFQWQDVDSAQRFGIRLANGKIVARYYYGNSRIYYQTGQRVAGVTGLEMVVGPPVNYDASDMKNAAVYELEQCSTYYMAIGFRDHLNDDGNSLSKKTLNNWKEALEAGTYTGSKSYLMQTDSEMNIIQTPGPEKEVANIGEGWGIENTLPTARSSYRYRLEQFVPWQHANAYYESFQIRDVLPKGVEYAGDIKILRMEDQKNVTEWFGISSEENVVNIKAKSGTVSSANFYGYHYEVIFSVRLNPESAVKVFSGSKAEFTVKNKASTLIKHVGEDTIENMSNSVTTKATIQRKNPEAPVKGFGNDETQKEKIISSEEDEIVFGIFQKIPETDALFRPMQIEVNDRLEECLEYVEASVLWKEKASEKWIEAEGWHAIRSGPIIQFKDECPVQYEGGTLLWQIRCKIKAGTDLSKWQKSDGEKTWIEIPNQAEVTFLWNKGVPQSMTQETNVVVVKLQKRLVRLTKEIQAEEIVWAHGNPVFTFRVEGIDLNGKYHIWNKTVEFTPDDTINGGNIRKDVEFIMPAGVYVAWELPVIRYGLEKIYEIHGGTLDGSRVLFDLSTQLDGEATFLNKKVTDEDESDTAFVRNQIGD